MAINLSWTRTASLAALGLAACGGRAEAQMMLSHCISAANPGSETYLEQKMASVIYEAASLHAIIIRDFRADTYRVARPLKEAKCKADETKVDDRQMPDLIESADKASSLSGHACTIDIPALESAPLKRMLQVARLSGVGSAASATTRTTTTLRFHDTCAVVNRFMDEYRRAPAFVRKQPIWD